MKNLRISAVCIVLISFLCSCEKEYLAESNDQFDGTKSAAQLKSAPVVQPVNWMGGLPDSKKLSGISVPGTHNSGARHETFSGTAKCQNLTIENQLNIGVRFLDVRCRHYQNAFTIHHGSVYQNMNFDAVLNACWDFLDNNPTECIIMSIKEEHNPANNNRTFEQTFDAYVQKKPNGWYLSNTIPDLGNVRGKIVLVRRFGASSQPKGIDATNWQDNTTFSIITPSAGIKVQDMYKVPVNGTKWNKVLSLLEEAKNGSHDMFYINFSSGYKPGWFGIPNIPRVSNYINPKLVDYLNTNRSGRYGSIMMDFVDADKSSLIYSTNF
jgi:1-phosphatidylinositol phosphodiesterase